jgi:hypothetical protein
MPAGIKALGGPGVQRQKNGVPATKDIVAETPPEEENMPITRVVDHYASHGKVAGLKPNNPPPRGDCVTRIVNKRFSKGLFVYLMFTIRPNNAE